MTEGTEGPIRCLCSNLFNFGHLSDEDFIVNKGEELLQLLQVAMETVSNFLEDKRQRTRATESLINI